MTFVWDAELGEDEVFVGYFPKGRAVVVSNETDKTARASPAGWSVSAC